MSWVTHDKSHETTANEVRVTPDPVRENERSNTSSFSFPYFSRVAIFLCRCLPPSLKAAPLPLHGRFCCAQQTGMHIVVVEALLNCYLPRKRADTLSAECLSRAISWSLTS
jgi:hypothetical protein